MKRDSMSNRFAAELRRLPSAGKSLLAMTVGDADFRGVLSAKTVRSLATALDCRADQVMLKLVPFARCYAIAPVSNYKVGAVAKGRTTGALYFGANMEYAGAPLNFTLHAEQSALNNAWLDGEEGLVAIAISAAPCGQCRQFLNEMTKADSLRILLPRRRKPLRLHRLLPDSFGPLDLNKNSALMEPRRHRLRIRAASADPVIKAALDAADRSYSPYTKSFAGVALETASGNVHTGRYAENAAFNPSISPLASALSIWVFKGGATDTLKRAVLIQTGSGVDHAPAAHQLLESVSNIQLEVHSATRR